ncbi:carbohydrate-binding protein [Puniceicoccaceae bacterium K14]|nr:carbohydrate-binding protein [Puniceicoccaceae bacterium K14]
MNISLTSSITRFLGGALFLGSASISQAAEVLWNNAGGDNVFSDSANWNGGIRPEGANHAVIDSNGEDRAIFSADSYPNIDGIYVGKTSDGQLDIIGGNLTANVTSSRVSRVGYSSGDGLVNQSDGVVNLNVLQVGLDSNSTGVYNLTGGDLIISRGSANVSLFVGTAGVGTFEISGGSFTTRAVAHVGVSSGSGLFSVVGSSASSIGIGSRGTLDGGWVQGANGTLKVTIDSGGLTKILIDDYNDDGVGGDVSFLSGSLLDVEADGELVEGSWVVMEWEGSLENSSLSLTSEDAIQGWSLSFEDRGVNGDVEGPDTLVITYEEPEEGVNLIKESDETLLVELELADPDVIKIDGVEGATSILGNAIFAEGAILDIEFAGELEEGSWPVLEWGEQLSDNGLRLDEEDANNGWSFSFEDRGVNGDVEGPDTLVITYTTPEVFVSKFVHPGITHKRSDLDRIKYMVLAQKDPWYSSYLEMAALAGASYDYDVQGDLSFTELGRDSGVNYGAWNSDIRAAYYNAIRWYVTGDSRHAEKAIEIFRAWRNLRSVTSGGTDALSGGVGYIMIEAAEIIKSTYDGWSEDDIQDFKDMLVYPGYSSTDAPLGETSFYWKAYQGDPVRHGNQGLSGFRTVMAMGIFLDNEIMYDRALRYIKGLPHRPDDLPYPAGPNTSNTLSSSGEFADTYTIIRGFDIEDYGYNEVMTNYIYENGQCQESSRDHQHTIFGISLLCSMSEMAWNQGEDLYSHAEDRLLLGLEYNMRYNVSSIRSYDDQPEPWVPTVESGEFLEGFDRTGRWFSKAMSNIGAGDYSGVRPVFEMPIAHYVGRGLKTEEEAKWTIRARDVAVDVSGGYEAQGHSNDAIGWGALTMRRPEGCYGDAISGFADGFPVFETNVLPGTIEAENFDYFTTSGDGLTYNDTTTGNSGGAYRTDENVDIEVCSEGGYNLTDMEDGEWMTYTVAPLATGLYDISVRYASAAGGGSIQFEIDGNPVGSATSLPATGSDTTWVSHLIVEGVTIEKGVKPMRVLISGSSNSYVLNNVRVELKETIGFSSKIEAEDFGSSRGVSIEDTSDVDGGSNLTSIVSGRWSQYTADLGTASILYFRIARPEDTPAGRIDIRLDDTDGELVGSVDVPVTGGWQDWETVDIVIEARAGGRNVYLMYIQTNSGSLAPMFNINWFAVDRLDAPSGFKKVEFDASSATLEWDLTIGAAGYILKRSSESGGAYEVIEEFESSMTSYTDIGLEEGNLYYYVIHSLYNGEEGQVSDELLVVPSGPLKLGEERIKLESLGDNYRVLIPGTVLGHFYQLMESDSLVAPDWREASEAILGTGGEVLIDISSDTLDPKKYYQVQVYR